MTMKKEPIPIIGPKPVILEKGVQPFVPKYQLTSNEEEILSEFKKKMNERELTEKEREFCEDDSLCRYLRARDWDLEKAYHLLLSTLKWYQEYEVDKLHPGMFEEEEARTGKMCRRGYDKTGRPVVYFRPRNENTKNYENQVKHLVYTLEKVISTMDPSKGIESWVFVFDFKGLSLTNSAPMSTSKKVLEILTCHYPERLGLALMIDAPYIFSMFYSAISPFIPEMTKHKIKFCSGKTTVGSQKYQAFSEFFEMEEFEVEFGGSSEYIYDHELYYQHENEDYENVQTLKSSSESLTRISR